MKKSLIALLLVVALVVTVSVFAVSAEDTNPFEGQTGEVIAVCEACGSEQTWQPAPASQSSSQIQNWNAYKNDGCTHFYYAADFTCGSGTTIVQGEKFCINLNGKTVTRASGNPYYTLEGGEVNLMDTSVEKTGTLAIPYSSNQQVRVTSGTFNQYGGNFTRGTFNDDGTTCTTNGGGVYMLGGTYNMYDGSITAVTTWAGGAVYLLGESTFNMYGGTINSSTVSYGGCAYLAGGATFNMTGGTITTSGKNGGTFYATKAYENTNTGISVSGYNQINITGGEIKDCVSTDAYSAIAYTDCTAITVGGDAKITNCTGKGAGGYFFIKGAAAADKPYSSLTITGNAEIVGPEAAHTSNGSLVYLNGQCTMTISGGTIRNFKTTTNGTIHTNSATASVTMTDGLIKDCSAGANGGVIAANVASPITITGGEITGCSATAHGGAIASYSSSLAPAVKIEGTAKINNCSAGQNGGAVYMSKGTLTVGGDAKITKCVAGSSTAGTQSTGRGGAIATAVGFTVTGNAEISECTSYTTSAGGGNIYIEGGTGTISGGTIKDGNAPGNIGGNLCVHGATTKVNFTNGTISGGDATNYGGNVAMMRDGAQFNMSGTAVLDATGATGKGKNIGIDKGTATINGGTVKGATADSIRLSNLATSILNLNGGEFPCGKEQDPGTWVRLFTLGLPADALNKVNIGADFTGKLACDYWASSGDDATAYAPGTVLTNIALADGYNADNLTFFVYDNSSSRKPAGINASNQLEMVAYAGVDADGVEHPVTSTAADYPYIKLYADGTVTLTKDTIFDMNNQVVDFVTNGNKLTVLDYRTDSCAVAAYTKFTVDNEENLNLYGQNPVNKYQYVCVKGQDGTWTSNRVKVDIDSVSIKPATAGMYYNTNIGTNANVAPNAKGYGVVLSLVEMPGANFTAGEKGEVYTDLENFEFDDEGDIIMTTRSCLLTGILPEVSLEQGGQTVTSGVAKIYATAYMCVEVGGQDVYIMADESYDLSLFDIMQLVDADETLASHASVLQMYETYQTPLADWQLTHIQAAYEASKA